ncbi:MAG: hypothetical protein JXQ26_05525 [Tissierellales bacterium]|jgi:hypothetical protein|nr:hypothetical protein [Tissierellales bacterium]MBN2827425.1 hypothetical protein [Tissierellales bacterium]
MYNLGVGLLISGTLVVFGSDILFRKGIIKDMKSLLIIKMVGLSMTITGMLIMIKLF